MAKLKTHKGIARRVKVTGTGKLMRLRAGRRHLLIGKPSSRTRKLRRPAAVAEVSEKKLRRLLPYS